jgi:DNA-binding protein H-NS
MNLKSMSLDKLVDLRNRVEATLGTRVAQERRMLESELGKLTRAGGLTRGRVGPGGKIPPKYRNPENPSETWAGRGLKPRWLAAALKAGKKMEHFAIAASAKTATKKARPKVRAARKK